MKKLKIIMFSGAVGTLALLTPICLITSSCSNNNELANKLDSYYTTWHQSLTNGKWNYNEQTHQYNDYSAKSEQQAIGLYAWCSGSFWNENLHAQKEPVDDQYALINNKLNFKANEPKTIFGSDYQYVVSGLNKAISPDFEFDVYHGVEYQEIEFWEQLKNLISQNQDETYDYSKIVGQTITSYGFISTTLVQSYADNFFDWRPHYDNYNHNLPSNPLKEPVLFKIKIQANTKGVAYLSNYDFAGFGTSSTEQQVLINKDKQFKIDSVSKIKNSDNKIINLFEVTLLK
ncbi:MAG: ADP-ribosyltransferase [Ureaplasma sp.]|nr:ADP-ribosyltransferase [Ureaplasma sp.]